MIRRDERHRIVVTLDRKRDPRGKVPMSAVRRVAGAYGLHTESVLRIVHAADRERHRHPAADGPTPVDGWS